MRRCVQALLLVCGIAGAPLASAEALSLRTAEGRALSVRVEVPPGGGRFPAVVLAPGQGYHMGLPAMEATSRALVAQGMAVFRFDWAYFSSEPKGRPSEDLSAELSDFQAVLALARRHPQVASEQVAVAGKSLGSLVAWRVFVKDPQLRGALLLTPVCSRTVAGEGRPRPEAVQNYPGLAAEPRPTLWISGHNDALCAVPVLYEAMAASPAARVGVVGGDHGYEDRRLPPEAAERFRDRSLAAVSALAAAFVSELWTAARP